MIVVQEELMPIASGGKIAYKLVGDLDDPTIIFANGSNFNYKQFDHTYLPSLCKYLDNDFSILLYDYIGYGYSSSLVNGFNFLDMAQHQVELMDALEVEQAHLFGLSKGSLVSHLVAALHPKRVLSLAGYGSPNPANEESRNDVKAYYKRRLVNLEPLADKFDERITEENYDEFFDTVMIPTMFERDRKDINIFQRIAAKFMKWRMKDMILGPKIGYLKELFEYYLEPIPNDKKQYFKELITSIKVPTLLMHGSDDPYIPPSSSRILNKWNSYADLHIIRGYKHNFPTLIPWQGSRIMGKYCNFLETVENGTH